MPQSLPTSPAGWQLPAWSAGLGWGPWLALQAAPPVPKPRDAQLGMQLPLLAWPQHLLLQGLALLAWPQQLLLQWLPLLAWPQQLLLL